MSATAAPHLARVVPRTVFRIFVVEGQTAERSVLGQLIRRNPSLQIAGEARTAEQALAMLGDATRQPDIVCVSWLLDGGDEGRWAFVDELRRRCPDARLMMTCPDERDDVLHSPASTASRSCTPRATRFTRCAGRCTTPPRASPTSRPA